LRLLSTKFGPGSTRGGSCDITEVSLLATTNIQ
jgi:hypothetical protein